MNGSNITGKTRASRIPLDYYKKPDYVFRRKLVLTGIASVAAVVWLATLIPAGKSSALGNDRFSHGPVCSHHEPFGNDCAQCHVNFPMLGGKDEKGRFKGDNKCMTCHLGNDGDVHHTTQLPSMTQNCGVCHTDHKGVNFDIRRVTDSQCTKCHKDLQASMKPGTKTDFVLDVTSFADHHPIFRNAQADPGKLKFNHLYHMNEGIVLTQGGKPFTITDMKDGPQKSDMMRRGLKANDAVKMECADCHTPEKSQIPIRTSVEDLTSEPGKKATFDFFLKKQLARGWYEDEKDKNILKPPHKNEAYMAPVRFDLHCSSCHPVSFGKDLVVTHGKQPDDPRFLQEIETLAAQWDVPTPKITSALPGKELVQKKTPDTKEKVQMALRALLEGQRACGECHVAPDGSNLTVDSKKVAIPNVPNEWYRHARFDHAKHGEQGIKCSECHQQAYFANNDYAGVLNAYAMPRKGAEQVMLPEIGECRKCHSPKPTEDAIKRGVTAKHDCAECHGYHHGTPPPKK